MCSTYGAQLAHRVIHQATDLTILCASILTGSLLLHDLSVHSHVLGASRARARPGLLARRSEPVDVCGLLLKRAAAVQPNIALALAAAALGADNGATVREPLVACADNGLPLSIHLSVLLSQLCVYDR